MQKNALLKGLSKNTEKAVRSFISGDQTAILVDELVKAGNIPLAAYITVAYTYQLRLPSEGRLQVGKAPANYPHDGDWHSDVFIKQDNSVVVKLRKRKNENRPTDIVRFCICGAFKRNQVVCGVCTLKNMIQNNKARGELFPSIKYKDIEVLREIGRRHSFGRVTWYGFRRGRATDKLRGLDIKNNPAGSIMEIAEALGHNLSQATFLKYISPKDLNAQQVISDAIHGSDSE